MMAYSSLSPGGTKITNTLNKRTSNIYIIDIFLKHIQYIPNLLPNPV